MVAELFAVYVPTTNKKVWQHPSHGTVWQRCILTAECHTWLNQHAGIVSWFENNPQWSGTCDSRGHQGSYIEFWDRDVALLFKLTWGGQ